MQYFIPIFKKNYRITHIAVVGVLAACFYISGQAQEAASVNTPEIIKVIGITSTSGAELSETLVPYQIQSANSEALDRQKSLDLSDFINRNLLSVTVNDAQNNPLQKDVQFRGYTLSPLLGLPQGISIYQNGIRINEPFGDIVNWDLIPESSIDTITLIGGANPVFGLNTLGGTLSVRTKNGFSNPGNAVESYGGSFERIVSTVESGDNNDTWGYFVTANYFDEDGWRDASPSDAKNLFAALSYRTDLTTADLNFNFGDTDLIGNGASPAELLALDREAVFTSPDQTENNMRMVELQATHFLTDTIELNSNMFYRNNKTDTFNGDGSEFEECEINGDELLVEFESSNDCESSYSILSIAQFEALDVGEIVEDQNGNNVAAENANNTERNAISNISNRQQRSFGGTLQAVFSNDLFGNTNTLVAGAEYRQGLIDFFQATEIATLHCEFNGANCQLPKADRSTVGTGLYAPEEGTFISSHNRNASVYFSNTTEISDQLAFTLSGRYNNNHIVISDRSGESNLVDPDNPARLNGEHDFERFNPAIGITVQWGDDDTAYGNYSEASRSPTPIELLCSDPNAPCNLPNAFLADPPLEQVVTRSLEGGTRGYLDVATDIRYEFGVFYSLSSNDIIFTSTGGVGSNEGFFRNVGDTRRIGVEFGLDGTYCEERIEWFARYSYTKASFQDRFIAASANHPQAINGRITVAKGNRIPGVPDHVFKMGARYKINDNFSFGGELLYNSGQYLRGDEANLLNKTGSYALINLNAQYHVNQHFSFFTRINNLFDNEYETFGLLGEADEIFTSFNDNRFFGPGAPRSIFGGLSVNF